MEEMESIRNERKRTDIFSIIGTEGGSDGVYFYASKSSADKSHANQVLDKQNTIRQEGSLLDITLVVSGKEFQAHKLVLASNSGYFKAMFSGGFKENNQSRVELQSIDPDGLDVLLDYSYTGIIKLSQRTVQCVLEAADILEYLDVVNCCEQFLITKSEPEDLLVNIGNSQTYSLEKLHQWCKNTLLNDFVKVSALSNISDLPFDFMNGALQHERINITQEYDVYEAVRAWGKSNPEKSEEKLLTKVRYGMMTTEQLRNILDCKRIYEIKPVRNMIIKALNLSIYSVERQLLGYGKGFEPRCHPSLMVIGGKKGASTKCHLGASPGIVTFRIPTRTDIWAIEDRFHELLCAAVLSRNGYVYVIGGRYWEAWPHTDQRGTSNRLHVFNSFTGAWQTGQNMHEARSEFMAAFTQEGIMVMGGINDDGFLSSCECYNIKLDLWERRAPLPRPMKGASACEFKDAVYVSGGETPDVAALRPLQVTRLKTMLKYTPDDDKWIRQADMGKERTQHHSFDMCDRIVVIAGDGCNEAGTTTHKRSIEAFNPEVNEWVTLRAHLPITISNCGYKVIRMGRELIFVGGDARSGCSGTRGVTEQLQDKLVFMDFSDLLEDEPKVRCNIISHAVMPFTVRLHGAVMIKLPSVMAVRAQQPQREAERT